MARRRSGHRALERRISATLRSLDISTPLDLDELCERLGESRGRPLLAVGREMPVPGPFGLWIATDDLDAIVYQSRTSAAHQKLIVLHELGHIMAGHSSDRGEPASAAPEPSDAALDELFPELPRDFVRSALRRESYDHDEEYEAEMSGTIILNWAGRIELTSPPTAGSPLGRRVQGSLGSRLGWR